MSAAARTLRVLMAAERHAEGYFRGIMRGHQGCPAEADVALSRMLDLDLRHATGEATITVSEFFQMCHEVRHQAALN